jgi:hypothetical protein
MSGSWYSARAYVLATMVYAGHRNVRLHIEREKRLDPGPEIPLVDDIARIYTAPLLWPCYVVNDHLLSSRSLPRYDNGE